MNQIALYQAVKNVYYNPAHPAGFGGISRLVQTCQNKKRIKEWLQSQRTYTLHKPVRKRYETRPYKVGGRDFQWQADLCEMLPYASLNNGMNYILTVIDVFSRYAWAKPIAHKTGENITNAFREIFAESGRRPLKLQTDQGKEFENLTFQKFLKENNIKFFTVKSQFKAALAERLNRTLKEKMWRYFTHTGSYRWLEVLPQIVKGYNAAKHRSIGVAPQSVNKDNQQKLWLMQERKGPSVVTRLNPIEPLINVGDHVRLSKVKRHFEKGYLPNFTEEIFTVSRIIREHGKPTQYKVKDYNGVEIDGSFYAAEIQKVSKPDTYVIETILASKGVGKNKKYLVKWFGYGPEFNSWETLSEDLVKSINRQL